MAAMQGQLQQLCMIVNQQPPSIIYAPTQQQQYNGCRTKHYNGGGGACGLGSFPQQPNWFGGNSAGAQHHGPIDCRNAQDHPSLSMQMHSASTCRPQQHQRPQQLPQVPYPLHSHMRAIMPTHMPMMQYGSHMMQPPAQQAMMMQHQAHQVMPMMAPSYAPNQAAPNQQQQNWGNFAAPNQQQQNWGNF